MLFLPLLFLGSRTVFRVRVRPYSTRSPRKSCGLSSRRNDSFNASAEGPLFPLDSGARSLKAPSDRGLGNRVPEPWFVVHALSVPLVLEGVSLAGILSWTPPPESGKA